MSSMFSKPKLETPPQQAVAPISLVEDAADRKRRNTKKPTGRQSAMLAGVANALKNRMGGDAVA